MYIKDAKVVAEKILEYESQLEKRKIASINCLISYTEDYLPNIIAHKFVSIFLRIKTEHALFAIFLDLFNLSIKVIIKQQLHLRIMH